MLFCGGKREAGNRFEEKWCGRREDEVKARAATYENLFTGRWMYKGDEGQGKLSRRGRHVDAEHTLHTEVTNDISTRNHWWCLVYCHWKESHFLYYYQQYFLYVCVRVCLSNLTNLPNSH